MWAGGEGEGYRIWGGAAPACHKRARGMMGDQKREAGARRGGACVMAGPQGQSLYNAPRMGHGSERIQEGRGATLGLQVNAWRRCWEQWGRAAGCLGGSSSHPPLRARLTRLPALTGWLAGCCWAPCNAFPAGSFDCCCCMGVAHDRGRATSGLLLLLLLRARSRGRGRAGGGLTPAPSAACSAARSRPPAAPEGPSGCPPEGLGCGGKGTAVL